MKYLKEVALAGILAFSSGCKPYTYQDTPPQKETVEIYRMERLNTFLYGMLKLWIKLSTSDAASQNELLEDLKEIKDDPRYMNWSLDRSTGMQEIEMGEGLDTILLRDKPEDGTILAGTDHFPDQVFYNGKEQSLYDKDVQDAYSAFKNLLWYVRRKVNNIIK